jgi:hypothetical protein
MKTKTTKTTRTPRPKKKPTNTKKKPIIIQTEITPKKNPTITIHVGGGCVQDIVKEKCNGVDIVVHDYDIQDEEENLLIDQYGKKYKVITF